MPGEEGIDAVVRYLEEQQVPHEVVEHRTTYTAAAEARAAGVPADDATKTIALRDGGGYRIAVIPASKRLDLEKAREVLGDRSLRLATEEEMASAFGAFEVGALPPFASEQVPELVDVRLLYRKRVLCAGGDHRHGLVVDPRDLVRLAEPRVADICEHDPGEQRFADVPRP